LYLLFADAGEDVMAGKAMEAKELLRRAAKMEG
jgi:hypothetical protein